VGQRPQQRGLLLVSQPSRKQSVDEVWGITEIRGLEASKSRRQIDQPPPSGKLQHSKCAGHRQTVLLCDRHPRSIIHQNKVGADGQGKCDRGTLALI
jgi:hypothetical protein